MTIEIIQEPPPVSVPSIEETIAQLKLLLVNMSMAALNPNTSPANEMAVSIWS